MAQWPGSRETGDEGEACKGKWQRAVVTTPDLRAAPDGVVRMLDEQCHCLLGIRSDLLKRSVVSPGQAMPRLGGADSQGFAPKPGSSAWRRPSSSDAVWRSWRRPSLEP
eukprot:6626605-Pyramimonas_sp.AAC.1